MSQKSVVVEPSEEEESHYRALAEIIYEDFVESRRGSESSAPAVPGVASEEEQSPKEK